MELLGQLRNPSEAVSIKHLTRESRRSRTQRELCIIEAEIIFAHLYAIKFMYMLIDDVSMHRLNARNQDKFIGLLLLC